MLLGGVSFVMLLFQLVNVSDDDVRRYAWKVISNTISIFMAVMFFHGNNEILVYVCHERLGVAETWLALIQYVHCSIYVISMLLTVAIVCGVFCESKIPDLGAEAWTIADAMLYNFEEEVPVDKVRAVNRGDVTAKKSIIVDKYGLEVAVVKRTLEFDKRKRQSLAWSTLLAHMGGFAAIAAGSSMQQSPRFRFSPMMAFLPVVVTVLVLVLLFQGSRFVRAEMRAQAARSGRPGRRAGIVHECVSEAENDILALSISFLTTQVVRYSITDILPNHEGLEPVHYVPNWTHTGYLALAGIGFMMAAAMVARCRGALASESNGEEGGEESADGFGERCMDVMIGSCAMAFAWCLFFASRWVWVLQPLSAIEVQSIDARIILALLLSLFCFCVVYLLDKIDDTLRESTGGLPSLAAAKTIGSIVMAMSLLVGFSWEHSFEGAVTAVADLNKSNPMTTKVTLGFGVFVSLLRPWRRFILKRSMQLDELKAQRDKSLRARGPERLLPVDSSRSAEDVAPLLASRGGGFGCC